MEIGVLFHELVGILFRIGGGGGGEVAAMRWGVRTWRCG